MHTARRRRCKEIVTLAWQASVASPSYFASISNRALFQSSAIWAHRLRARLFFGPITAPRAHRNGAIRPPDISAGDTAWSDTAAGDTAGRDTARRGIPGVKLLALTILDPILQSLTFSTAALAASPRRPPHSLVPRALYSRGAIRAAKPAESRLASLPSQLCREGEASRCRPRSQCISRSELSRRSC